MKKFLKEKLIDPITGFLKQGLSPERLAEGISWGLVVGFIPILGGTTIICTFVSFARKINMGVIQLVQWFVYPLQLLFFLPFLKLGGKLTGTPVSFSLTEIQVLAKKDPLAFIKTFALANLGAVLIWIPVAAATWIMTYFILKKVFATIKTKDAEKTAGEKEE